MIVNNDNKSEIVSNVKTNDYSINTEGSHIFDILATLYVRPIDSMCREIATNCLDAHRLNNNEDRPFVIKIPNSAEKINEISFRDFGPGLSEKMILEVFMDIGKSTKQASKKQTGFFGIGSKSPGAVSDVYYVKSYQNGKLFTYISRKNAEGKSGLSDPIISDTTEENGIEIVVPIYKDVNFREILARELKYFAVKPIVKQPQGMLEDDKIIKIDYDSEIQSVKNLTPNIAICSDFYEVLQGRSTTTNIDIDSEISQLGVWYPVNGQEIKNGIDRWKKLCLYTKNKKLILDPIRKGIIFKLIEHGFIMVPKEDKAILPAPSRETIKYTDDNIWHIFLELNTAAQVIEKFVKRLFVFEGSWDDFYVTRVTSFATMEALKKSFGDVLGMIIQDMPKTKKAKYFEFTNLLQKRNIFEKEPDIAGLFTLNDDKHPISRSYDRGQKNRDIIGDTIGDLGIGGNKIIPISFFTLDKEEYLVRHRRDGHEHKIFEFMNYSEQFHDYLMEAFEFSRKKMLEYTKLFVNDYNKILGEALTYVSQRADYEEYQENLSGSLYSYFHSALIRTDISEKLKLYEESEINDELKDKLFLEMIQERFHPSDNVGSRYMFSDNLGKGVVTSGEKLANIIIENYLVSEYNAAANLFSHNTMRPHIAKIEYYITMMNEYEKFSRTFDKEKGGRNSFNTHDLIRQVFKEFIALHNKGKFKKIDYERFKVNAMYNPAVYYKDPNLKNQTLTITPINQADVRELIYNKIIVKIRHKDSPVETSRQCLLAGIELFQNMIYRTPKVMNWAVKWFPHNTNYEERINQIVNCGIPRHIVQYKKFSEIVDHIEEMKLNTKKKAKDKKSDLDTGHDIQYSYNDCSKTQNTRMFTHVVTILKDFHKRLTQNMNMCKMISYYTDATLDDDEREERLLTLQDTKLLRNKDSISESLFRELNDLDSPHGEYSYAEKESKNELYIDALGEYQKEFWNYSSDTFIALVTRLYREFRYQMKPVSKYFISKIFLERTEKVLHYLIGGNIGKDIQWDDSHMDFALSRRDWSTKVVGLFEVEKFDINIEMLAITLYNKELSLIEFPERIENDITGFGYAIRYPAMANLRSKFIRQSTGSLQIPVTQVQYTMTAGQYEDILKDAVDTGTPIIKDWSSYKPNKYNLKGLKNSPNAQDVYDMFSPSKKIMDYIGFNEEEQNAIIENSEKLNEKIRKRYFKEVSDGFELNDSQFDEDNKKLYECFKKLDGDDKSTYIDFVMHLISKDYDKPPLIIEGTGLSQSIKKHVINPTVEVMKNYIVLEELRIKHTTPDNEGIIKLLLDFDVDKESDKFLNINRYLKTGRPIDPSLNGLIKSVRVGDWVAPHLLNGKAKDAIEQVFKYTLEYRNNMVWNRNLSTILEDFGISAKEYRELLTNKFPNKLADWRSLDYDVDHKLIKDVCKPYRFEDALRTLKIDRSKKESVKFIIGTQAFNPYKHSVKYDLKIFTESIVSFNKAAQLSNDQDATYIANQLDAGIGHQEIIKNIHRKEKMLEINNNINRRTIIERRKNRKIAPRRVKNKLDRNQKLKAHNYL